MWPSESTRRPFLKITWPWYGQLANQVVTVAKAYALGVAVGGQMGGRVPLGPLALWPYWSAVEWNRTLVMPGLAPSDKHPNARLGFFEIFSRSALAAGPAAVITQLEYDRCANFLHVDAMQNVLGKAGTSHSSLESNKNI